jgi:hypothetical protein
MCIQARKCWSLSHRMSVCRLICQDLIRTSATEVFFSNRKSTFLWANLLTLEPFASLNGATWGPSPMGGISIFLLYRWLWWWRSWWNEWLWQRKSKYSEKTCPDATLSTTNSTCQTRARTRAPAVGSQRLTASAMAQPGDTMEEVSAGFRASARLAIRFH